MPQQPLGQILIKAGLISEEDLKTALEAQSKTRGEKLGETLLKLKMITDRDLARALSFAFDIPYIDLEKAVVDPNAVSKIPAKVAAESGILPICIEDGQLVCAMKDPLDLDAVQAATFASGMKVNPAFAAAGDINDSIKRHFSINESVEELIRNVAFKEGIEIISEAPDDDSDLSKKKGEMAPIIKLVNSIILQAFIDRASDIHIEPKESEVVVRYRIDGVMLEKMNIPKWIQGSLISRTKIMAGIDIAERRIPQDGRIQVKLEKNIIEMRVSTLPTQYGEKIVIRVLASSKEILSPGELGIMPQELAKLVGMMNLTQGMILVCGPTGSGKSTTLYAILNELAKRKINIITVEDPVEYRIAGINQVQINEKTGLTFANSLRSILRQDPDVVFVGEIRDGETAEIAMRASITGHLVLSTIHTNSGPATISRLRDLQIDTYLINSSLSCVISQRLLRVICDKCRVEYTPPTEIVRKVESKIGQEVYFTFYHGKGCEQCQHTGYKGRIGVYEILIITNEIKTLINNNASESQIRNQAKTHGMITLEQDAIEKLKQGITTYDEIERVLAGTDSPDTEDESVTICKGCNRTVNAESLVCQYCGFNLREKITNAPEVELIKNVEEIKPAAPVKETLKIEEIRQYSALVVDDDDSMLQSVAFYLLKKKYQVTTASNGREALDLIKIHRPHIVVTDICMPEMDGLELIKELRINFSTTFIPVIIMSAKGEVEDRIKGFETGADDYLPKPFSLDELYMRMQVALKRAYRV